MTAPLLLLSGAGLPPWIWNDMRLRLPVRSVVAPRPDVHDRPTVTDYAHAALEAAPRGPVTLVAHSSGGLVAAEIARLDPARVAAVLAVSAIVPTAGGSFVASLPLLDRLLLPLVMRVAGTRPPEATIRTGLAAGLEGATVDQLVAELRPEPRSFFTSRVPSISELRDVEHTSYLVTTKDTELAPTRQFRFAERMGAGTSKVASGHLPMLTHPDALVSAITGLG